MKDRGLKTVAEDAMETPLPSTRDAPFQQLKSEGDSAGGFTNKLGIQNIRLSDSEYCTRRSDSNQSSQQPQRDSGEWSSSLGGCLDCRRSTAGDFAMVACCPCISAAKIHGMLGASIEVGVIYFGSLVFAMVLLLGLGFSNMSGSSIDDSSSISGDSSSSTRAPTSSGYMRDDYVAQEADSVDSLGSGDAVDSDDAEGGNGSGGNALLYRSLALAMLALFLLGVALLRTKARKRFSIPGHRAADCFLSTVCCWCVLSQTQRHLEKSNRHELHLDTPPDTLPAFL